MSSGELLRDDRADSFFQIGDLTKLIAEQHCAVPVDDVTHQRWRELLGLLREFDTLVDDTDISHDEALAQLASFENFKQRYPALGPEQLPADNRTRLLGRTATLLHIGDQLAATTDVDEFAALRVVEGTETTCLIDDCATPETRQAPGFQEKFLPVMRSLGVTACLLDSMSDARQDYQEDKISIVPDRAFYARLAKETAKHARPGLAALAHPPIMRQFAVMSVTRLKNRWRHGRTPYSSLRNISP